MKNIMMNAEMAKSYFR